VSGVPNLRNRTPLYNRAATTKAKIGTARIVRNVKAVVGHHCLLLRGDWERRKRQDNGPSDCREQEPKGDYDKDVRLHDLPQGGNTVKTVTVGHQHLVKTAAVDINAACRSGNK